MLTHDDARGVGALGDSDGCACGAAVRMTAPHECICRGIFGCVWTLACGFRFGPVKENMPDLADPHRRVVCHCALPGTRGGESSVLSLES